MIAESPLALSYILPGDVFFLPADKAGMPAISAEIDEPAPIAEVEEPVVAYIAPTTAPVPLVAKAPEAVSIDIPAIPKIPVVAPPPAAAAMVTETPVLKFNYKGGYQQKFLVIVHYPQHELMDPAHLTALESTIKRKEMSLDDVAIFNIGQYPGTDIKAIGKFFKPKRMLLLGNESFPVGMPDPVFNQLTMLGTCQLLSTHSFGEMMGKRDITKAFWAQMQLL